MAQQEEIPTAMAGRADSIDASDHEVELDDSLAEDEEVYSDASDEDETYFGGPNGHADNDDDDDFAEAHGVFATPAGSNMGDDDEHAIDDMHRSASEAIEAAASHQLRALADVDTTRPPATSAAGSEEFTMTPAMALSSLNYILNRNAHPDPAVLEGLTRDNVLEEISDMISHKVTISKPESIRAMADALRPILPASSDQDDAAKVDSDSSAGAEEAGAALSVAKDAPRAVEGNSSSGEEAVRHVEQLVSPPEDSSSAAEGASGASSMQDTASVDDVKTKHGNGSSATSDVTSKSAADIAGDTSAPEVAKSSAVTGSSSSGSFLRASSSINDSDSDSDVASQLSQTSSISDEMQQEKSVLGKVAPAAKQETTKMEAPAVEATAENEVEDITPEHQAHAIAQQLVLQAAQATPASQEAADHTVGGNGSTAPFQKPPPFPAHELQQQVEDLQKEKKLEEKKQDVKEPSQTQSQQAMRQARGPSLPQRSGPSLPLRPSGSATPSLPPRPSLLTSVARSQPPTPVAASQPAAAPAAPAAATTVSSSSGAGSGGPSLPTRPPRSGPTLPARTAASRQPASAVPSSTTVSSGDARSQTPQPMAATAAPSAASTVSAAVSTASAAASTAPASNQQLVSVSTPAAPAVAAAEEESEENKELRCRVQALRVMLLRITSRIGVSTQSSVVQQVLMRLDMAERIKLSRRPITRGPSPMVAAQTEAAELESGEGATTDLPFCCTVMLLGLTGGGKSSLINRLLDKKVCAVSPFEATTKKVEVIEGSMKGVDMRFIDTPGLQLGASSLRYNQNVLTQVKKAFKKMKPDVVLWVDRLDILRRPGSDLGVLQQVSDTFGNAFWFNTISVMTHAAKVPPEGSSGPVQYSAYINHRVASLQQGIRAAAKDYRLMNPTALVENHPSCRRDESGEPILPNGIPWRQQLLMLGISSKLLVDAEKALDIQKGPAGGNTSNSIAAQLGRYRPQKLPPIPYLLSQMIQMRRPFKFPEEERTVLSASAIKKIKNHDERKEEFRKRRVFLQQQDQLRREEEEGKVKGPVAIPAEELPLQPTFDPELGYNRYFHMPSGTGWVAQPHVEENSVEHDDGVEGITIQLEGIVRPPKAHLGGAPSHFHAQLHADKTTTSVISEASGSIHHSRRVVSTCGVDFQTVGNDHLWAVRGETRAKGLPGGNRIATGITASRLVDGGGLPTKGPVVYGVKLEDRVRVRRNIKAVASGGLMTARTQGGKEIGIAANAKLSSTHGLDDSTVALVETSLMKFRKDLMIGGNASVQTNPTPQTQVSGRINLNTKGTGGVTLRVTSHDRKELAYSFAAPLLGVILGKIRNRGNDI